MMMRRDEARHDDRPRAVDDERVAGRQRRTDGGNAPALDEHVGLLEVTDGIVEAQHHATAEEHATASVRRGARGCAR
jgi:hypothetical protein